MNYTRTAVALHWLLALLIFAAFHLGVYMHELPLSPTKLKLYSWHNDHKTRRVAPVPFN